MTDLFGDTGHDPGGKVRLRMQAGVTGSAQFFGERGEYRPELTRQWSEALARILWIGMNPSTAAENINDPTIVREIMHSRKIGPHIGGLIKCNIMDYRATNPKILLEIESPRSEANLPTIIRHARAADRVIVAWGAVHKRLRQFADETLAALEEAKIELWCLGTTKDGSPRHPLYIRRNADFRKYR